MVTDASGNVYVAGVQEGSLSYGETSLDAGAGSQAVLVKYNAAGAVQWAILRNDAEGSVFTALALDGSGNVYASGYTTGSTENALLAKYGTANGSLAWEKIAQGSAGAGGSSFHAVVLSGTNVYAAGTQDYSSTVSYGTGSEGGSYEIVNTNDGDRSIVVKYTENGTPTWHTISTATNGQSMFLALAADSSGNVYAGGVQSGTLNYGNGVSEAGGYSSGFNAVVVKYNTTSGTAQWAKSTSAAPGASWFRALAVDASGIYAAGHQGTSSYTYGSISVQGTASGSNAVIVKYNVSGTAQWAKSTGAGSVSSAFFALAADASGIYAAGVQAGNGTYTYDSGVSVAGGYTGTGTLVGNSVLVKYNSSGSAQWAKTAAVGPNFTEFQAAAVGSSGVYAAGAQTGNGLYVYSDGQDAVGPGSNQNPVVVKFSQ
jgi:hypothetical protein